MYTSVYHTILTHTLYKMLEMILLVQDICLILEILSNGGSTFTGIRCTKDLPSTQNSLVDENKSFLIKSNKMSKHNFMLRTLST